MEEYEAILSEMEGKAISVEHVGQDYSTVKVGDSEFEVTGMGQFIIMELITRNQEYANEIEILRETVTDLKDIQ